MPSSISGVEAVVGRERVAALVGSGGAHDSPSRTLRPSARRLLLERGRPAAVPTPVRRWSPGARTTSTQARCGVVQDRMPSAAAAPTIRPPSPGREPYAEQRRRGPCGSVRRGRLPGQVSRCRAAPASASRPTSQSARTSARCRGRARGRRWTLTPQPSESRSRTTSASRAATARAVSSVGASTITRTSGSVPEGRSSTRPWPAERGLLGGHGREQLRVVGAVLVDAGHVDQHLRQPGHHRRRASAGPCR